MSESSPTASLPESLEAVFIAHTDPDALLAALLPPLCDVLACDRCFFYLRNPHTAMGAITHCYSVDPKWEDMTSPTWKEEGNVAEIDPLFATALATEVPVYVADIETASPDVVNMEFERQDFKHRALIHAPIYFEGQMYGILEPCVFEVAREWTEGDRQIITELQRRVPSVVVAYLRQINRLQ